MDNLTTLAQERERKEKERNEKKRREAEERRKIWVPRSALIIANVIFLSLDIRALQAVWLMTGSWLLASVTVLISGGLALYWFDVLYPHSRRHKNDTQKWIALVFTTLAIGLSGVLAFADYIVGTGNSFSPMWSNILWGSVIVLTIAQGVAIGWWWSIDKHIESEAKIEEAHAEAADQADEMSILRTKLQTLRGVLDELNKLDSDYNPTAVRVVANALGIVLPTDGKTPVQGGQKQRPQVEPEFKPVQRFGGDTDGVKDFSKAGKRQE